jgi:hypothetical protein
LPLLIAVGQISDEASRHRLSIRSSRLQAPHGLLSACAIHLSSRLPDLKLCRWVHKVQRHSHSAWKQGNTDAAVAAQQSWFQECRMYRAMLQRKREAFRYSFLEAWRHDPRLIWRSLDWDSVSVLETSRQFALIWFYSRKLLQFVKPLAIPRHQRSGRCRLNSGSPFFPQPVGVSNVITAVCRLLDKCCMCDPVLIKLCKSISVVIAPLSCSVCWYWTVRYPRCAIWLTSRRLSRSLAWIHQLHHLIGRSVNLSVVCVAGAADRPTVGRVDDSGSPAGRGRHMDAITPLKLRYRRSWTTFYSRSMGGDCLCSIHQMRSALSIMTSYFSGIKSVSVSRRLLSPCSYSTYMTAPTMFVWVQVNDHQPLCFFL